MRDETLKRTPGAYVYPREKPPPLALTENSSENDEDAAGSGSLNPSMSCCSPARIGIGVFLLSVVAFVIVDSLKDGYVREGLSTFLEWMERHPKEGVVLFMFGKHIRCTCFCYHPLTHHYIISSTNSLLSRHNNAHSSKFTDTGLWLCLWLRLWVGHWNFNRYGSCVHWSIHGSHCVLYPSSLSVARTRCSIVPQVRRVPSVGMRVA